MLPQANRLRSREDFKKVYQSGRHRRGVYLTVRCLKLGGRGREGERERGREGREDAGTRGRGDAEKITNSTLCTGEAFGKKSLPRTNKLSPECFAPTNSIPPSLPTRIGISIGLKVSKKAVVRNRIKRQIRAALRQILPRILPGRLVVVTVQPTATQCNYADFLRELEQLLAEAEVLDGHS